MAPAKPLYDLVGFARFLVFTHGFRSYRDIRTELLAEAFRHIYGLPPFPTLEQLVGVCTSLGIKLSPLPPVSERLLGVNTWHRSGAPQIHMRTDLSTRRAETTLGHELREVIENALKRACPWYQRLETSDNRLMKQESDQFAGCLLMQARATHDRLTETGFDLVRFAAERERSLPSVILRARELYHAGGERPGPVAGLWLFEAPWQDVTAGTATSTELTVRYWAHLSGFSASKSGNRSARLASLIFPKKGARAGDFLPVKEALELHQSVVGEREDFDLFGQHNFVVAAEPIFSGGTPWRAPVTAVRKDTIHLVKPWLDRLNAATVELAPDEMPVEF